MKKLFFALAFAMFVMSVSGCTVSRRDTTLSDILAYTRHLAYARGHHDCQYPQCKNVVHFTKSGTGAHGAWWKEYVCSDKHVILIERR
jgi:hypothetical protein